MGVAANSEVPGRDPEMSVTPVPAATVILLRDSANGPETLLIERHARSEFLPDMYVFPGGRVEARDQALAGRLAGLEPAAAAALLPSALLFQPPPRRTRTARSSESQSLHHSQTLPCISYKPKALQSFCPTS